jgi:hypothetical protein
MKGKQFIDLSTNKVVKVIDSFEDVSILEGNAKIRSSRLLDTNFFEPYIDPATFFKSDAHLNEFANKLKQIPTENLRDDEIPVSIDSRNFNVTDESAIIPYDPEEEKRELMRKYNIPQQNDELIRQNEAFAKLLEEETIQVNVDREVTNQFINPISDPVVQTVVVERRDDPIITMFKNCKRTLEFKLDLSVNEKIPRTDFIEMMEDSYTISIIDYLAEEFTNKLLNDPSEIKRRIKEEINKIVYPKKQQVVKPVKTTKAPVKPPVKPSTKLEPKPTSTRVKKKKITEEDDKS